MGVAMIVSYIFAQAGRMAASQMGITIIVSYISM